MLAKPNRVVSAEDYKRLVRKGSRRSAAHTIVYFSKNQTLAAPRFGFIVAKNVGNAVIRNRVRRQLKALAFERLSFLSPGAELVIRALPGSAEAGWDILRAELAESLNGV